MLFTGLTSAAPSAAGLGASPELTEALGSLGSPDHLYKVLVVTLYGTVIVLSVLFQGLNSLYYFTRRKHIDAYLQETPPWVLDVQTVIIAR